MKRFEEGVDNEEPNSWWATIKSWFVITETGVGFDGNGGLYYEEIICPECTKTCPDDKVWVYFLTWQDQLTLNYFSYITEMGKPLCLPGWTGLALVEIESGTMDKSNLYILNKLVKHDTEKS